MFIDTCDLDAPQAVERYCEEVGPLDARGIAPHGVSEPGGVITAAGRKDGSQRKLLRRVDQRFAFGAPQYRRPAARVAFRRTANAPAYVRGL